VSNFLGNYCIVRRQWDRDALAIWFCQRKYNNQFFVAKPLALEFSEDRADGMPLPEPTLILPGPAMKEFYEQLRRSLELEGEAFIEAQTAIKTKDAHLADLQKVIERTFGLLERGARGDR